jgi:hypothetical protein
VSEAESVRARKSSAVGPQAHRCSDIVTRLSVVGDFFESKEGMSGSWARARQSSDNPLSGFVRDRRPVLDVENNGQPFTHCPSCGLKIDPANIGAQYAVEMQLIDTLRGPEYFEGIGGFFHRECLVPAGWQARPKP